MTPPFARYVFLVYRLMQEAPAPKQPGGRKIWWTGEKEQRLRELRAQGLSIGEIAQRLNKSKKAIKHKAWLLRC